MKTRFLVAMMATIITVACGDGPTGPTPQPQQETTPTPTTSTDVVEICTVLSIVSEIPDPDKNHPNQGGPGRIRVTTVPPKKETCEVTLTSVFWAMFKDDSLTITMTVTKNGIVLVPYNTVENSGPTRREGQIKSGDGNSLAISQDGTGPNGPPTTGGGGGNTNPPPSGPGPGPGPGPVCTFTVQDSVTISEHPQTFSVSVTTQDGCTWTAGSNTGWINLKMVVTGVGSGYVVWGADKNTEISGRQGQVTVAGKTVNVLQSTPGANSGS